MSIGGKTKISAVLFIVIVLLYIVSGEHFSYSSKNTTSGSRIGKFVFEKDAIITHENTGLSWKRCAEGYSDNQCSLGTATALTWVEAQEYVSKLNKNGGYGGYSDWRIPTVREWTTILSFDHTAPAINKAIFPAAPCCKIESSGTVPWPDKPISMQVVDPTHFWTSTNMENLCYPYYVELDEGKVQYFKKKPDRDCTSPKMYLQLVRGKKFMVRFNRDRGETVSDTRSNLMWKRCPERLSGDKCEMGTAKVFTLSQIDQYIDGVNKSGGSAGYSDWRLPTILELITLVDFGEQDTNVGGLFPDVDNAFWSSTPWAGNRERSVWIARRENYYYVAANKGRKSDDDFAIALRLVRTINEKSH